MRMKSRTMGALARGARFAGAGMGALLLSALLAAGTAFAGATFDTPTDRGTSVDCWHGVFHQNASCLHGWWDNSPPASTGVALGSTWGVHSQCGDWGTVYGRVRTATQSVGGYEYGYLLEDSDKKRGNARFSDVLNIKCCPEKGELCHKSQVRALNGKIKIWDDSSNEYVRVDVSTREKRQEFCRQYRDGVYCRNNLSGDAISGNPYNCGNHYCTVDDCEWHYEQSRPSTHSPGCADADSGFDDDRQDYEMTISATDGSSQTCTLRTHCLSGNEEYMGGSRHTYADAEISTDVWNMDDLINCSGTLQVGGSCDD